VHSVGLIFSDSVFSRLWYVLQILLLSINFCSSILTGLLNFGYFVFLQSLLKSVILIFYTQINNNLKEIIFILFNLCFWWREKPSWFYTPVKFAT